MKNRSCAHQNKMELSLIFANPLQLDDTTVPLSDWVKSLSALLDSALSMGNFISQTSRYRYQLC